MRCRPILVLDDDPHVRALLATILEKSGFKVVSASDARSALAQCEVEIPQLMIVDLMLPVEDGEAFLDKFRLRHHAENVPVIVLSASARRDSVARRVNASATLAKPFTAQDLRALVHKHTTP